MKIQRIQITIEPMSGPTPVDRHRIFTVQVWADGRHLSAMNHFDDDHFHDVFGHLMRGAEQSIRTMITAGETSS